MKKRNNMKSFTCSECGKEFSNLERFPNNLCLDCHDRKHRNDEISKPDFVGTINKDKVKTLSAKDLGNNGFAIGAMFR